MEYDYKKYRKDSQAALRNKPIEKDGALSHYEPREEVKKDHKEPKEKMLMENAYGAVNLGIPEKKQEKEKTQEKEQRPMRTVTVSGLKEGRYTESRDSEHVRETGSVALKGLQKRAFTNSHEKENSAMGLRVFPWNTGEKIVGQLQELAEKENLQVVRQMLPFLYEKPEKEKIQELREAKKADGGLVPERERYLELLEQNQLHRQQQKRKLVHEINHTLAREQQGVKEEKKDDTYDLLWKILQGAGEAAAAMGGEPGNPAAVPGGEPDMGQEGNPDVSPKESPGEAAGGKTDAGPEGSPEGNPDAGREEGPGEAGAGGKNSGRADAGSDGSADAVPEENGKKNGKKRKKEEKKFENGQ